MVHKSIVRNAQYRRGGLNKRERHNERKNINYQNEDIIKERADLNVHFKQSTGGYESAVDAMLADKIISTRGLGKDPYIVDELVFDVNSEYFENYGGYEYAKSFYQEAYQCAIKEIGGEQFVLSAVMHADEHNKALSGQLGYDVYHYHLHVVYVPVVDKEIYFKKNNKNPELAGKLREVIKQVSHSKKWPKQKKVDDNGKIVKTTKGKPVLVNAYSLLQDHFYEHMRDAGFKGFERGERGSTAEHLTVLEYKSQQEKKAVAALAAVVEQKQEMAAALDTAIEGKTQTVVTLEQKTEKKQKQLDKLDEQIVVRTKAAATVAEIEAIGKPALLGGVNTTTNELNRLKMLAKKGITADEKVLDMRRKLKTAEQERDEVKTQLLAEKKGRSSISEHLTLFNQFTAAMKRAPRRLMAVTEDILHQPPERAEEKTEPIRKRDTGLRH